MDGNPNGFTLIELLVVVAIIGVLAAVGVIAFNGFMERAKINSTKSQHKTVVNYIQTEFQRCSLGEENLNYKKWISSGNEWSIIEHVVSCSANADMHAQSLDDHFEAEGFANPFGLGRAVERVNVDFDPSSPGFTHIFCLDDRKCKITTHIHGGRFWKDMVTKE